jgi:hypothetical protein
MEVRAQNEDYEASMKSRPLHVLFNQFGRMLYRHNKPIDGTMTQMSLVQGLVSRIEGTSIPVLYLFGMLYPKHFWASATHDPSSILGCPPISCYRGTPTHPDGFASHIEMARNHLTHASSSSATDDNFASTHYDAISLM